MQSFLPDGAEESGAHHVEEDAASQCSPQASSKWRASKASVLSGTRDHGKLLPDVCLIIAFALNVLHHAASGLWWKA